MIWWVLLGLCLASVVLGVAREWMRRRRRYADEYVARQHAKACEHATKIPPRPMLPPEAPPLHYNCRSKVTPLSDKGTGTTKGKVITEVSIDFQLPRLPRLPNLPNLPLPSMPGIPSLPIDIPGHPGVMASELARLVVGRLATGQLEHITTLEPPSNAEPWQLPFVARRLAPDVPRLLVHAEVLLAASDGDPDNDLLVFELYAQKDAPGSCISGVSGGMYEGPAKEQDSGK